MADLGNLEICGVCWFFIPNHDESEGVCMRYPPNPNGEFRRPVVKMTEWCGEFKIPEDE